MRYFCDFVVLDAFLPVFVLFMLLVSKVVFLQMVFIFVFVGFSFRQLQVKFVLVDENMLNLYNLVA